MFVNLEKTAEWFEGYVRAFDLKEPMIQVKHKHSFDVMRIGESLTDALNWGPEDRQVGVAACLLHDTGRFPQYRDFGTYSDSASIDHGDRGHQVLLSEFPADLADAGAKEALLQAVKWHNKKSLPELPPEVTPFCRLARDADKLDVFSLVQRSIDDGTIGALLPRHAAGAPLSEALVSEVEARFSGSYKNASSLLDFLLIQLTWTLDVNFLPSLRMLEESGVLSRIRERFPKRDERVQNVLRNLFAKIEEHKSGLS